MRAAFATNQLMFEATVDSGGQRLLDLLNSSDSEFLRLRDVIVQQPKSDSEGQAIDECIMRKSLITIASPLDNAHEAPVKRWNAHQTKSQYPAFLALTGFQISGMLHLKGARDPIAVLKHELASFVPVSNATVVMPFAHSAPILLPTVFVNTTMLCLFHFGRQRSAAQNLDAVPALGPHE